MLQQAKKKAHAASLPKPKASILLFSLLSLELLICSAFVAPICHRDPVTRACSPAAAKHFADTAQMPRPILRQSLRRVALATRMAAAPSEVADKELKDKIANFYDQSSPLWEEIWGEHMHMGHYGREGDEVKNDQQAQIDMVDRLLEWGDVNAILGSGAPTAVLDIGCGVGGSSRHIAKKYAGASVTGITLSPIQCEHAKARSERAGLTSRTDFRVADALKLPFPDNSFDLLWSMESGEHMPNKAVWLAECTRVLKPGGRMLMATWTHRPTGALVCGHESNEELTVKERKLLSKISKYYHLPQWVSTKDYVKIAQDLGMRSIREDDWSKACGPFWPAVWKTALSWKGFKGLLKTFKDGLETIKGARAVLLMIRGFNKELVRLGLITFSKPKPPVEPVQLVPGLDALLPKS
jgi:tocopherol O-methyltransferase